MKKQLAVVLLCAFVPASIFASSVTLAQEWPSRPVTVVFPYRAGGGGDGIARLVMSRVSEILGQQFIIENRAGAGGLVGTAQVARARPDGYTFLISGLGSSVVAPAMAKDALAFDSMKSFTHVALLGGPPPVLVVHEAFPAKSVKDYVALSLHREKAISFGSPGQGSHSHLVGELFRRSTRARMVHIPYSGGGQAISDVLANHIPSAFLTFGPVSAQMGSGKIRILAIATASRRSELPDVPTFEEQGLKELTGSSWFGLSAPAGLPREISMKLNAAVRQAMSAPKIAPLLAAESIEVRDLDPDTFTAFFQTELTRWTPIIHDLQKAERPAGQDSPAGSR